MRPVLTQKLRLTESQALCFELGNWLRDVSQFRDPYALQKAKLEIYREEAVPKEGRTHRPVVNWFNQVFGPHYEYDKSQYGLGEPIVAGAFGEWFRHLLTAYGIFAFRLQQRLEGKDHLALSEADFERLFKRYFTQYYPHEHLDFPPTGDPKLLGDWSSGSYRMQYPGGPPRRVLAYLDDFVDYIATHLLQAEMDLKRLYSERASGITNMSRQLSWQATLQDTLVKLGKASHAIEDYYFHSNFSELAFLYSTVGSGSENIGLRSYLAVPNVARLQESYKRKLFRRIRAPLLDSDRNGNSILSTSGSDYARYLFTGMFEKDDIQHTFSDAFESFSSHGANVLFINLLDSTLFKFLLDPTMRRTLVKSTSAGVVPDKSAIQYANARHIKELKAETLVRKADTLSSESRLFAASVKRANQVDLAMVLGSTSAGIAQYGIGYILLMLAARAEAGAQNSSRKAQAIDEKPKEIHYMASNNTISAESVGTHTLLAKDSVRKLPLREETDRFASYAVGMVINALATQITTSKQANRQTNKCVDWGDLLRRLMCHPAQAPGDWSKKVINSDTVPYQVFAPSLIDMRAADTALQAGIKHTFELEQAYRDLYLRVSSQWAKEVE